VPDGDVETYYEDGQWKNKFVGNDSAASVHQTRGAAVGAGRQMAALRGVQHVIRDMDGAVAERNDYHFLPRMPKADPPKHAPNGCGT
jgi:hypothetical protein